MIADRVGGGCTFCSSCKSELTPFLLLSFPLIAQRQTTTQAKAPPPPPRPRPSAAWPAAWADPRPPAPCPRSREATPTPLCPPAALRPNTGGTPPRRGCPRKWALLTGEDREGRRGTWALRPGGSRAVPPTASPCRECPSTGPRPTGGSTAPWRAARPPASPEAVGWRRQVPGRCPRPSPGRR